MNRSERAMLKTLPSMTPADRAIARKLVAFLPKFETGEEPSTGNWFMDFYTLVTDKFDGVDYQHCIERLKDTEFIRHARITDLKAILLAACRSEDWSPLDYTGSLWRHYNRAGTFTTALRRLAELEKGK